MNWELVGISIYILSMLLVGVWVSKRIKTEDDYFLAGRSLGPYLATFSIFATWFGAETCIGTAGNVYSSGLANLHADPIGYSLCLLLMAFFFSRILWHKKITTIPDLFRERFSPHVEKLAAILLIPSSIIWAGAQVRALGQIIQANIHIGPEVAVTVAALVVVAYTMLGGLLADAYNDLIQGIAVIIGLLFILIALIWDFGSMGKLIEAIPAGHFSFSSADNAHLGWLGHAELWLVPILGSLMAQELVSRVVASRSPQVAFNSSLRAAICYFLVGCIPVLIGLVGPHYFPGLTEPETLMPLLAKKQLSYFYYIVFIGALVSAILSTVDTTLLSASALASHNLIYPLLKGISEKQKVRIARGGTLLSGLAAYFIAFSSDSITGLVELSSSLGGPSILVITIIALWVKVGDARSAICSIVISIGTWIFFHTIVEIDFPVLATVIACGLSYFVSIPIFSRLTKTAEVVQVVSAPDQN